MVTRTRLLEPLLQADWRVLTVVAPSGYGKTVFLAQLADALAASDDDYRIAWLQLDSMDTDPRRLLRYLGHALVRAGLLAADAAEWDAACRTRRPSSELLDALVSRIDADGPACLVLDGLQYLVAPEVSTVLASLLRYLPETLRVAQAGHRMPALEIGAGWSDARYPLLGVVELGLNADEALAVLEPATGLEAGDLVASGILERLRGWPAGVEMLCSQAGESGDRRKLLRFGGTDELPQRYFDDMMTGLADGGLREDLLRLAVTGVANGELMSSVFGGADWPQRLEHLARSGVLTYRDRRPGWFLLHPWLADFLRAHFEAQDPDALRKSDLGAATWLAGRGYPVHAVRQALLARQGELALGFIHACLDEVVDQGHLEQVQRWRQALPDSYLRRFPMVIVMWGWSMLYEGRLQDARLLSESIEPVLNERIRETEEGSVRVDLQRSLGLRAVVAALIGDDASLQGLRASWDDYGLPHEACGGLAALAFAEECLLRGALEEAESFLRIGVQRQGRAGSHLLGILVDHYRARTMLESGQLEAAWRLSRLSADEIERPWIRAVAGPSARLVALQVAYERNELSGASDLLRQLLAMRPGRLPASALADASILQARLHCAEGDGQAALDCLNASVKLLGQWAPDGYARLCLRCEILRVYLAMGDAQRAARLANDMDLAQLADADGESLARVILALEYQARLRWADGRPTESLQLVDRALQRLPEWMSYRRARLLLLKSLLLADAGRDADADELLAVLLDKGRQAKLLRVFVDEGAAMHERLKAYSGANHLDGELEDAVYLDSLLAAFVSAQRVSQRAGSDLEHLTDRELQILQMVEKGNSNQEISERLYLSLGTVKWHLHNVYEKLLVKNRTQAIHRAQEEGLL